MCRLYIKRVLFWRLPPATQRSGTVHFVIFGSIYWTRHRWHERCQSHAILQAAAKAYIESIITWIYNEIQKQTTTRRRPFSLSREFHLILYFYLLFIYLCKKTVKISVISFEPSREHIWWNGGIAPHILNLGTSGTWVVSLTQLYPQGTAPIPTSWVGPRPDLKSDVYTPA